MNQSGGAHQGPVARFVVLAGSAALPLEKLHHKPHGAGWGLHTPWAAHSGELANASPDVQIAPTPSREVTGLLPARG